MATNTSASAASTQSFASRLSLRTLTIILACVAFAAYVNTVQNGFVLDDATVITQNTIVTKGFAGIPELLVTPRLKGFTQGSDAESYRPVPMVLHAIEYQLFGEEPAGYHFINVLLFACCVVALFRFLSKLFAHAHHSLSFFAALLFAVHPIHTEVVANIKSCDELLSFLFAFLALGSFARYAATGGGAAVIAGSFLFLLSLLSKETSICFIAVIPLVFFFYLNESRKRSTHIAIASVVTAACFLALRTAVIGWGGKDGITFIANPLVAESTTVRLASAFISLGMYLRLLFVPYPLIADYSYSALPVAGWSHPVAIISVIVHIALLAFAVFRLIRLRRDAIAFGVLFYLIAIALFSNIAFLVYSQFAERFAFFASAGFCLAIAALLAKLTGSKGQQPAEVGKSPATIVAVLAALLLVDTVVRNADWKDNYTLFSSDIRHASSNARLHFYLATTMSQELYPQEADPTRKVELDQQSVSLLYKAVEIYPAFSEAHAEMGRIYERNRMFDSAIVHDKRAVELNPRNLIATYNLARAYYSLKQHQPAIHYFRHSTQLDPNFTFAWLNLAKCFADSRQYDSAIVYYHKTLELEPGQQIAVQGLARAQQLRMATDTLR